MKYFFTMAKETKIILPKPVVILPLGKNLIPEYIKKQYLKA